MRAGDGGMAMPGNALIAPFDAAPDRLDGGAARVDALQVGVQQCGGVLRGVG